MLTFSAICEEFVKAEGFSKKECGSDNEAKSFATKLGNKAHEAGLSVIAEYPVVFFTSDTTGEKAFE